ncbi:uncharacterized protein AB675_5807 [Cyphellophora attinorum]|uniref:Transmembrane protein n=1 Tax=Cyphellophora attinorum TaxID=1664694 RepID=A0A0N0NL78_9EURO|nr:uncharacterized protein AB675_5807 [Phialophora attinorum]KPI38719.1 hypothetical protein AB675_5807 [Phialophora attinorum]
MSWKFAELKWRQDLGIYESWDGRDVDWLPLERKRAIRAFQERQKVSHPHRRSISLQHFPMKQVTRDGSDGNSEVQTLPALPALPSQRKEKASNIEEWCQQNKEDFLRPLALDCRAGEDTLSPVQRSHSFSAVKNRPGQVQAAPTDSEDEKLREASPNHKEDSQIGPGSSLYPSSAAESRLSTGLGSREELRRLLEHVQPPAYRTSAGSSEADGSSGICLVRSLFSSRNQTADIQAKGFEQLQPWCSSATDLLSSSITTRDFLRFAGGKYRLLNSKRVPAPCDIASPSDTSATALPSTVSRHRSTSLLLPHSRMADFRPRSRSNVGSPFQDRSHDVQQGNAVALTATRRTTPTYPTLQEAHASVTGSLATPHMQAATPDTDTLNNVYARPQAGSSIRDRTTNHSAAWSPYDNANIDTLAYRPTPRMPFQQPESPDSLEHDFPGEVVDNPAGLRLGTNDVALRSTWSSIRQSPATQAHRATYVPSEESSGLGGAARTIHVSPEATRSPLRSNGHRISSSPPSYGSTRDLLGRSGANGLSLQEATLPLVPVTNGHRQLTGSTLGEDFAVHTLEPSHRRQNGVTSNELGAYPFPVATSDSIGRFNPSTFPVAYGPVRQPSGGATDTASDDEDVDRSLLETDHARNSHTGTNGFPTREEDEAWETTQGTDTQRNSTVPDGSIPAFGSDLAGGRATVWSPLAPSNQNLGSEITRLRSANNLHNNESAHTEILQGSRDFSPLPATPEDTDDWPQPYLPRTRRYRRNLNHQGNTDSLTGSPALSRQPANSDTLFEMASDDSTNDEREARRRAIEAEIERYDPDRARPVRVFRNATLYHDRRVFAIQNDRGLVSRQRRLTSVLLVASLVVLPFGGFAMVDSIANNGAWARGFLLEVSTACGGVPVNHVHQEDAVLAARCLRFGSVFVVAAWGVFFALLLKYA